MSELTPDEILIALDEGHTITAEDIEAWADAWQADRDEHNELSNRYEELCVGFDEAKQRVVELEASIKYALTHTLIHKAKELDAPFSADMHLSQAIERLNSAIEYEPKDAERAEHLNYAVELVGMTRPKK